MPIKQLKSEYSPYELRRKLVNRFDLFLCKTSLLYNPKFISALGKFFIKYNKQVFIALNVFFNILGWFILNYYVYAYMNLRLIIIKFVFISENL